MLLCESYGLYLMAAAFALLSLKRDGKPAEGIILRCDSKPDNRPSRAEQKTYGPVGSALDRAERGVAMAACGAQPDCLAVD